MNCIFCNQKMTFNRSDINYFNCLKCHISYSLLDNVYYGIANNKGLTDDYHLMNVAVHITDFSKINFFNYKRKINLTYKIENITLEAVNNLARKIHKMSTYL